MIEISTNPRLAYSKAFVFVMEHFVQMLKLGHAEESICINNGMSVTFATENDAVVGACVYDFDLIKRQAWIYLAAVDVDYRRKGVYNLIYEEVERQCKANGMVMLNSNVHVDNISMIQAAKKHDRILGWYRTSKKLL